MSVQPIIDQREVIDEALIREVTEKIVGCHAQQHGKKYLKAFLLNKGWTLKNTHCEAAIAAAENIRAEILKRFSESHA